MMLQIALTIVIVFVLGLAFAVTSHMLGRGDKRPGCGHGTCSTCNPANRNAECPSETGQAGLFAGLVANPLENSTRDVADANDADEKEADPNDTDVNDPDPNDTARSKGGQAADSVNG